MTIISVHVNNDFHCFQVDYKDQGFVDEEEFIEFAKKISYPTIASILNFEIIPETARLEAKE